jgi:hypothetical protein
MDCGIDILNVDNEIHVKMSLHILDTDDPVEKRKLRERLQTHIIDTAEIIHEYKQLLQKPMKMSFIEKPKRPDDNTFSKKNELILSYYKLSRRLIDELDICNTSFDFQLSNANAVQTNVIKCVQCNNSDNLWLDNNNDSIYVCMDCFTQQNVKYNLIQSYKDGERINIFSKYEYDRKLHFRDVVNQYSGKQNCTVEDEVYTNLEKEFGNHFMLVGNASTPREVRFGKITKDHIIIFLKELNYSKHYENVNLIHHVLTGKKPDDISYLEDKLVDDFEKLTTAYQTLFKHLDRKNFINTQFVLFHLLRKHKHQCKYDDFPALKTLDRKNFHDDVTSKLFEHLGWNYESNF